MSDLQKRGVDTAGVERAKGKTFRWRGRYSKDLASRETLDTQLNVFADFRPKIPAAFKASPYVLLGNIHPALQLEVLAQVDKPKLVVADTMNFWITGEAKLLGEVLKKVDLLVINDEEARELTGIHNLVKAAADIRKRGPKHLIIKRGEHGALYFDDAGAFFAPAYPLEDVVDPTGAGDSFAGGLIGYLTRVNSLEHPHDAPRDLLRLRARLVLRRGHRPAPPARRLAGRPPQAHGSSSCRSSRRAARSACPSEPHERRANACAPAAPTPRDQDRARSRGARRRRRGSRSRAPTTRTSARPPSKRAAAAARARRCPASSRRRPATAPRTSARAVPAA